MDFTIPPLLLSLIATGKWRHPGDDVIRRVIPALNDPVDFRPGVGAITVADEIGTLSPSDWDTFKLFRDNDEHRELPWLNADRALFIAMNRIPGDDVTIALYYRDSPNSPTVVANCWKAGSGCEWFEVAPTFEDFARVLGIENAAKSD